MSALSDLVYGKNKKPWPHFTDKYPVKVQQITGLDNDQLERDIRESGDQLQGRTAAKCLMTRWDMHDVYPSFRKLGEIAIQVANMHPLAGRSKPDGTPDPIPYQIKESWGLIYEKGNFTEIHSHWPSTWGYVYTVCSCPDCSPLIFDEMDKQVQFVPKDGQLLLFPAWLHHHVPEQKCEHPRIKIAGNLDTAWNVST